MATTLNDPHVNSSLHSRCTVMIEDDTEAGLYISTVLLLSNFVVGLPANVWVLWLICHGSREVFASEIYLLNLAVCEIFLCLGLPGQLYCMYGFGHVSDGLTMLLEELSMLVWVVRPLLQSCVCVERYIAVVHPLVFIRFKPLKYKVAQCALALCVYPLTDLLMRTFPRSHLESVIFVSTFCLLWFCCFSVLCSLKQPGPGEREGEGRRRVDRMKKKAFNIILVHLASISVNYVPFMTVQGLRTVIHIPGIVMDLIVYLAIPCGLVQPLLYLLRAGKPPCVREHRPEG